MLGTAPRRAKPEDRSEAVCARAPGVTLLDLVLSLSADPLTERGPVHEAQQLVELDDSAERAAELEKERESLAAV